MHMCGHYSGEREDKKEKEEEEERKGELLSINGADFIGLGKRPKLTY
jgi:hypothetical protein